MPTRDPLDQPESYLAAVDLPHQRTAGIIGGIGPESTIDYYRLIIAGYRERSPGAYPSLLIDSIDLDLMLELLDQRRMEEFAARLAASLRRLAAGGADFALMAANTPHLVFDELAAASPIPLLSIVEAALAEAQARGLSRPALLGTRFTMQGAFYLRAFRAVGLDLATPRPEEQDFIHEKYLGELIPGRFLAPTRQAFLAIIERLRREEGVDGLLLAGTELPLLLREAGDLGLPQLDTTLLHVARVVELLLEKT